MKVEDETISSLHSSGEESLAPRLPQRLKAALEEAFAAGPEVPVSVVVRITRALEPPGGRHLFVDRIRKDAEDGGDGEGR